MIRLIMVRHGQTTWNAESRYQGQSDPPLDATGEAQAAALARYLTAEQVDAMYSSDLLRARQTAAAIAQVVGLQPATDPRLRELAFGSWEGLTYREIQQRWPEQYLAWQNDPVTRVPPGGETLAQTLQRVGAFVADLRSQRSGQTVMAVAHGGSLRAIVCFALNLPSHAFWRLTLASGSISELQLYPDTAVLTLFNDRHAVREIEASPWVGAPDIGKK